jgi:hypothetical protein
MDESVFIESVAALYTLRSMRHEECSSEAGDGITKSSMAIARRLAKCLEAGLHLSTMTKQ